MKDDASLMTIYRTTIDGNWKQTVCKAKLMSGALTGNESTRITRLLQRRLGISYGAAKQMAVSLFPGKYAAS